MKRQTGLNVVSREGTGKSSGKHSTGGHEMTPVSSIERSILSTLNEMERMFDETIHRPFYGFNMQPLRHMFQELGSFGGFSPAVDIFDEGSHIVVKSELPGINKEDVKVEMLGNILCICGEKKAEEKIDQKGFFRMERSHGSFRRNLSLPEGIDYSKAKADFKDGVLEIRIPKSGEKGSVVEIKVD